MSITRCSKISVSIEWIKTWFSENEETEVSTNGSVGGGLVPTSSQYVLMSIYVSLRAIREGSPAVTMVRTTLACLGGVGAAESQSMRCGQVCPSSGIVDQRSATRIAGRIDLHVVSSRSTSVREVADLVRRCNHWNDEIEGTVIGGLGY